MDFLVANKNCTLFKDKPIKLAKNAVYQILNFSPALIFYKNNPPALLNLDEANADVISLAHAGNNYYLLTLRDKNVESFNQFSCQNSLINVSLNDRLIVSVDGQKIFEGEVEGISYLGYENFDKHIVIYFEGARNFVVIIKDKKLLWADYYDEINTGKELYLLKRLNDNINHGKVACIKAGKFKSFLVYLDNLEINLQPKFMPLIFLDLYLAGNYKYCNNLLSNELHQQNARALSSFLPEFDFYFPFNFCEMALIKNRALVAKVKFECADKITNIIIE